MSGVPMLVGGEWYETPDDDYDEILAEEEARLTAENTDATESQTTRGDSGNTLGVEQQI